MGKEILMAKSHGDFIEQIESRDGLIYVVVTDGRRLRSEQVPNQAAAFARLGEIGGNLDGFLSPPAPTLVATPPPVAAPAATPARRTRARK